MKICIFGAGAVGGHVATRLAFAGHAEVSLVARGAHLAAIQAHGLTLNNDDGESWHARIEQATDRPDTLPPQDVVLVTLKACALPAQAETIGRLLKPDSAAVFMNNGIPWWWNHGAENGGGPLPLLDPEGGLWNAVRPERALGAVVYSSNEIESPGVITHRGAKRNRFVLGGPRKTGGAQKARLTEVEALFKASGLPAEVPDDLYREIWHKLLVNTAGNPISALTRLSTAQRAQDPELHQVSRGVATEIAHIAEVMGWPVAVEAIAAAVDVGKALNIRPSMLQDVLLNRPMEVEALLGQPQRFARERGIPTPYIDVLVPLLRGLDRSNQGSVQAPMTA
jgi:2-dehydropantoate 2-reductase